MPHKDTLTQTSPSIPEQLTPPVDLPDDPFLLESPGSDRACLLIHGSTGTPSDLLELGRHLHTLGYTVEGVALPGHAQRPPKLRGVGWEPCYEAVHAAWTRLAAGHRVVHVIGFSFGGSLALRLAAHEPVDDLVLLAPGLHIILRPIDVVGAILGVLLPFTWIHDRMRWHIMLLRFFRLLKKEFGNVRCPVLIIHARDDYLVQVKSATEVHELVSSPDRRLVLLDRGGHLLPSGPAYREVWQVITEHLATTLLGDSTARD